ncbi:hypothetical protein HPP92_000111 [Vanilla planifolia]|uniref:Uncharacterized protein n=1 Tax=Vanilla planifolia TaxID=51239 RepID=A0A835S289_VANPL|nr:hypothetical protein HPP92_000111 [Vanilla planifolia]
MGDRIVQTLHSNSSVEHAVDAADFAFQPKNGMFISRSKTTIDPFEHKENPQEISERILCLSQSLSNKDIHELFSLPPQGFDISLTQQQLYEEHDRQHTLCVPRGFLFYIFC